MFRATLEKGDRALGWTIARVPFSPSVVWPERVRLRVKATLNGFAFRTSLFRDKHDQGSYVLLVNKRSQGATGVSLGSVAEFTLEPDLEPRPAELPEELDALLDEAEGLREWYESLSEYTRREIGKWVQSVKTDEARLRRAQQMAERMLFTLEAEHELPPAIARALQSRPKAQAGWAMMTPTQRRMELFAVGYYQAPESCGKRIDKLCTEAEKRAS